MGYLVEAFGEVSLCLTLFDSRQVHSIVLVAVQVIRVEAVEEGVNEKWLSDGEAVVLVRTNVYNIGLRRLSGSGEEESDVTGRQALTKTLNIEGLHHGG